MKYRPYKSASVNFTGGEPTVNPNFIEFCKYLKNEYNTKYADKWECNFTLTSNGAMGTKMADSVMEHLQHVTISYHAEADQKLKQQVKDRILQFHKYGPEQDCHLSINVMFHAEYFDECIEVCKFLDDNGVRYTPRVIGEEAGSPSNLAHMYTEEQLAWMKEFWSKHG
jgi:sulfatase maturation enzyme AslB (radical SAM superfamily)